MPQEYLQLIIQNSRLIDVYLHSQHFKVDFWGDNFVLAVIARIWFFQKYFENIL